MIAHQIVEGEGQRAAEFTDHEGLRGSGHRGTIVGGRWARTGGSSPSNFSTCTSTCAPVHPRASDEVPTSSVSTFGLPCTHIESGSAGSAGSYQAPVDNCTTSGRRAVVDDQPRQARPAVVEHPDDVAVGQAPCRRICGMHPDGFAPLNFRCLAGAAAVELAVQPGGRLIGQQVQREALPRAAPPSHSSGSNHCGWPAQSS